MSCPRLVLYGDCNGVSARGYPFIETDDYGAPINGAFLAQHVAKYDLVIMQPRWFGGSHALAGGPDEPVGLRLDILDAIRGVCPGVPIIAHFLFRDFGWVNTFDHWSRLFLDEVISRDAWQFTAPGVHNGWFNLAFREGGELTLAAALADVVVGAYHNTHFGNDVVEGGRRIDGVMLEMIPTPRAGVDPVLCGYPDDDALEESFAEGFRLLNDLVRQGIGDGHLCGLGNGDGYAGTGPAESNPTLLNANANHQGWGRENFPLQNDPPGATIAESWYSNMVERADRPGNAYLPEQALYRQPNLSCLYGLINGLDPTTTDAQRRARWIMASAALGEGFASHGVANQDDRIATKSIAWAWPWATRSWGPALGPATLNGLIWERQFENGVIRVNPEDVQVEGIAAHDSIFVPVVVEPAPSIATGGWSHYGRSSMASAPGGGQRRDELVRVSGVSARASVGRVEVEAVIVLPPTPPMSVTVPALAREPIRAGLGRVRVVIDHSARDRAQEEEAMALLLAE